MPLTADFYQEFVMQRGKFDPKEFGVEMSREEFTDLMVDDFNAAFKGNWTIDELVLHPREAAKFCDDVRHARDWRYVPDDIILRSIMSRRKNP